MHVKQHYLFPLMVVGALLASQPRAQTGDPLPAHWQPQQLQFSYSGFTTAYTCDAPEHKVQDILVALGAHPNTQVTASGCVLNRPSRTAFLHVITAVPRPIGAPAHAQNDQPQDRRELLRRLDLAGLDQTQFTAQWQTFQLDEKLQTEPGRLNLAPGDCELMANLRDEVLPQLGFKVLEDHIVCTPHQLGITTPKMRVTALIPQEARAAS